MAKSFTSLDDIKSAIEGMGFKIGNVWYDGNRSRPVFVCSREGLPHDIEVWAESPKYVNGVTIKDVSARDFDMVDGGEDVAGLKKAIRKALAYMGVKESRMKITVKEAKIYTTDDFKAAAEEERFKNRAEIWADQFNAHAEYIGLKDRARVEKDIHGCDSVVWDYGYIVAKDPFGDKWQVRFGDNAYTLDKNKVTLYMYKQMDSMTGFKGEAYSDYKPLMDKVYDWYEKKNFWKEEDFWKDLEALYAHNYPNVGFKFVFKGDDECAEIYTKDGLLFTYSWKPVGRDRRFRVLDKDGDAIMKHPGFNFKDDVYYAYRGITGKDLAAEWYENVSGKPAEKKQERQGYADNDVRLNGEDLVFVVTGVTTEDRGYDLAVSVKEGETYTLDELGYEISGMCENCNGYPTATRMDDILVVAIQAPIENDEGELTEDYWDAIVIEGYVKVVGDKLDDVAAYLEG